MYLCIYLYIWLLKYKRSKTTVLAIFAFSFTNRYTGHVGKMLLSIW